MKTIIFALLLAFISSNVLAQEMNTSEVILTPKEVEALRLAQEWSDKPVKPIHLGSGKVVYVFGATMPTIIGAPMEISDIELEPGEVVNEILVGDSARWLVESGSSQGGTTHIFIKPVDAGLRTSLVITTNKRVYHMKLVSKLNGHTPYVGFLYESQSAAVIKNAKKEKEWRSTLDDSGQQVDMSNLNFGYTVRGSAPWKPVKVYDDGFKMYLRLPDSVSRGQVPALLVRQGGEDTLVNYRFKNSTFEVDGIFPHVVLITGVGRQQSRIDIKAEKVRERRTAQ